VLAAANEVQAGGLTFSGLDAVDGGNGADTLDATATGSATLGTGDFALTAGGIDFSNILAVTTATLNANGAGSSFVLNSNGSVTANGMAFSQVSRVNGGAGQDSVSGGNDWARNAGGFSNTDNADIAFVGIEDFATNNGALTDNLGGAAFVLGTDNSVTLDGAVFTGLSRVIADGAGDLDASSYSNGLSLTGDEGALAASGLTFSGLSTVRVPTLIGSDSADRLVVVDNASISARSMVISGVSTVESGGAANVAVGQSGVDWLLTDSSSAENNGISFSGFSQLEAVSAGLVGTAGDDVFVVASGQRGGTQLISVGDMTFANLTFLDAGGEVSGDQLWAGNFDGLELTGAEKELLAGSLSIRGIETVDVESLAGSSSSDVFTVTADNAIFASGMDIVGLQNVSGQGGDDTISAVGFTATEMPNGDTSVAGILFSDVDLISGVLYQGSGGDDKVWLSADGSISYGGKVLVDILGFDAGGGDDIIYGADGLDWFLESDNSVTSNGFLLVNFERIEVAGAGLYGTDGIDNFALDAAGIVSIGDMSFSGLSFVDGLAGSDTIDASGFSDGLALSNTSGLLTAGSLQILGVEDAMAGLVIGTASAEQFSLSDTGELSVGGFDFSGVERVQGGGGNDQLASGFDDAWSLSAVAGSFAHGGVTFNGFTNVSGGNGLLTGHTGGHQFAVAGDNRVRVGTTEFSGITGVDANGGDDGVTAAAQVSLSGSTGGFSTSGIAFSGIDRVTAASVVGSALADIFNMTGSGAFSVAGIDFSGVSDVTGGAGSENDQVVSRAGIDYTLSADDSVFHDGITFSGIEAFEGAGARLSVAGQDSARITASGSVASGLSVFTGVESMAFEDQATQLEALNGVTVNGSGAVTSGGIAVTGVTSVANTGALTATRNDDELTVTGRNGIALAEMQFEGVSSVAAGVGNDTVLGLAGNDWQLGTASGALDHAGIAFTGLENAAGGSGVVRGSSTDTEYSLLASGALNAGGIRFDAVNSVVGGSGVDTVRTASGLQWVLGDTSGTASAQNVAFSGIDQIATASARIDAAANTGAETFSLAADTAQVSVMGLLFEDVAEVAAGGESGDTVVSSANLWQLAGASGQVAANGVTFTGINRVTTEGAGLAGSGADENFSLTGTVGEVLAGGIEFSGVDRVDGNGGSDRLTATSTGEEFVLGADGSVGVAGVEFSGISRVDSAGGEDVVRGETASWTSVVSGGALQNGAAVAELESVSVLFENLERVANTGHYTGTALDTEYFLQGQNRIQIGGVTFDGLQTLAAGAGNDTLYSDDADLNWTLGSSGGRLDGSGGSLDFSGFENIVAGAGADRFTLEGGALTSLDTGAGNDVVSLRGTLLDQLVLGSGNDEVTVLSGSQPTAIDGGSGDDRFDLQLAGQTWRVNGGVNAFNQAGEYRFKGFESLADSTGGLHLATSQQLAFSVSDTGAAVSFPAAGMVLGYDPSGDLVLESSNTATVTGTLGASNADLTLAGDLDINSAVDTLSVHTSGGNINVAVIAEKDLILGQIDAGNGGSVQLLSAGVGKLTAGALSGKGRDNQHIIAGQIGLGTETQPWGDVGTTYIPLGLYATESANLYAITYYDPFILGGGIFAGFGDRLESVAGAQTAQGLRSTVQSPADDIAQLDPAIFTEVSPYSLSVEALNSPELRLLAGELVPVDEREKKRRKDKGAPVANGGK
ncbi:beta strand repeat-containing protein, partial [Microbulbifer sp. SA54]|uniref:beta strand repeat-containing protein n=1 Tax=Microbulbifer sp. SA54 TaxID=3401577 RepID=UPI003AAB5309